MKKTLTITTALSLIAAHAFAQVAPGANLGTTEAEIRAALESQGYVVISVDLEDGEAEVTLNGVAGEIEFDTAGLVTEVEVEDDDMDEDGDSDDADSDADDVDEDSDDADEDSDDADEDSDDADEDSDDEDSDAA